MTRINTNVTSLVAQNRLNKSNSDLQTSLTRLSTGLRINSGKDDPAGLIASEALRSDITSINKAISNTQRASQIIATADSALGQVSSLLNDIRGLVVEAANKGALSDDEIAANQLQIDSSLEAINRISQTTTFQGRKLLDGSLDFVTAAGTNFNRLSNLDIQQANLGSAGSVTVDVQVSAAASKAQVDLSIPAATTGVNAGVSVALSNTAVNATGGAATINGQAVTIAVASGAAAGAEGNQVANITIEYSNGGADTSTYDAATNTLAISLAGASGTATLTQLQSAATAAGFTVAGGTGATTLTDTSVALTTSLTGGRDAGSADILVQADAAGSASNGVTVTLQESGSIANNTAVASLVGGNIVVDIRGTVSYTAVASAIDSLSGYSASVTAASGDGNYIEALDTPPAAGTLVGGLDQSGGLAQDVVFELSGRNGAETFNFQAGTSISQLAAAINLVKDSTGIGAIVNSNTLEVLSVEYGSAEFVNVEVISEAIGGSITSALGNASKVRDLGTDVEATVNGNRSRGVGNQLSINTATLDLSTSFQAGFTGTASFTITGGGAQFQLGAEVVSNQQARLGIGSVSTGKLGGVSGRLYELGSGQSKALATDISAAGSVIDEVIGKITNLRGRLGAFQATTLESNLVSLNETVGNLTEAESSIRDADFAAESARLTRAQILVQSGTSVLGIANQNPQNVLSLLR
jgi:flagellin